MVTGCPRPCSTHLVGEPLTTLVSPVVGRLASFGEALTTVTVTDFSEDMAVQYDDFVGCGSAVLPRECAALRNTPVS